MPNTQIIYYDFPAAPVLYELHNMRAAKDSKKMPNYRGSGVDTCVQCEGGYVMLKGGRAVDNRGKTVAQFKGGANRHFENFIAAVRSGRREDLRAEILEGHLSTAVCHAGNISQRLGKKASPEETRKQIGNLPPFQKMFDDYLAHLKAHDVDPGESVLGPWLECDRERECIKDNAQANLLCEGRVPRTVRSAGDRDLTPARHTKEKPLVPALRRGNER